MEIQGTSRRASVCTRSGLSPSTFLILISFACFGMMFNLSANAAVAFVQSNWIAPAGSPTTASVKYSNPQTAGNLNVVIVGWGNSTATIQSVTDTKGNVYALAAGPTIYSGVATQSIYYAKNIVGAAAGSNTVKIVFNTGARLVDLRILEYSGLDVSNPLDVFAGAIGNNSSSSGMASSGPVITSTADELLIAADGGEPVTNGAGSGFTSRVTNWDHHIVEEEVTSSVGTYTGTAVINTGHWVMQMVAFRAAGSQTVDTTLPSAPTGFAATAASSSQITLNWTASTDDVGVTGYLLERCTGYTCATFAQIASPTTTSYTDTGLPASTSFRYRVRAIDAAGNLSGYSNLVTVSTTAPPDTTPPTAPANVMATAYIGVIELTWAPSDDNLGVANYIVERCQGVGCSTFSQIASVTSTSYDDPGLASATSYSYRVSAIDLTGNVSDYSEVVSTITQPDTSAPTAPIELTATTVSTTQINLAWSASTDDIGVTGYIIERCPEANCSAFAQIAITTAPSYSDNGLTASTSYLYRVAATDSAGNLSYYSNTANAITQSPPDTSPPSVPENLSATTFGPMQVNLSWIASFDNVGVTGYLIERCLGSGCSDFAQVGTATTLSYSDVSIAAATNYSYRIRATDAANNLGDYSNVVNVATPYSGPITYTYSYDNLGRVIQATGSDGSVITYTYDANGNVTTLNRQ